MTTICIQQDVRIPTQFSTIQDMFFWMMENYTSFEWEKLTKDEETIIKKRSKKMKMFEKQAFDLFPSKK